ncbi:hypothetical protein HELRODRAFT_90752, partial [Helobdella robusta]|uniref:Lethal giant larvae homologue 2 domain-containing protein n=1 Tax=Helobdella robusta TaxID=6412 RepID=T1G7V6_HELRO
MHGNNMTVLEMEHNVVDFLVLCSTPWNNDFQDPHAVVALLQNDLVVVDLTSPGYPCFENPYPMDIHESPVTVCCYIVDCPLDLIPAFYSVGSKRSRAGYSEKEWPINGGDWDFGNCNYPEIIITGHADGSVKFWDASGVTLQVLYKLKTAKVFESTKNRLDSADDDDDSPFAIQHIYLCTDSRLLCVAGSSHVILFRFSKQEAAVECPVIEISIVYEVCDDSTTPDHDQHPIMLPSKHNLHHQSGSLGSYTNLGPSNGKDSMTSVKARSGLRKWQAGYQPELCCLLTWLDDEPSPPITSLSLNSKFGLLAFGDECGVAIVDILQKTCLLSMGTPDLYGSLDPYSRAPRSPKLKSSISTKLSTLEHLSQTTLSDDCKSPTMCQIDSKTDTASKNLKHFDSIAGYQTNKTRSSQAVDNQNSTKESLEGHKPIKRTSKSFSRLVSGIFSKVVGVNSASSSVLVITLTLPPDCEMRRKEPVIISPSGTIFRLKGSILAISFLDSNGSLIPAASESWKDLATNQPTNQSEQSPSSRSRISPIPSVEMPSDRQYSVICSEKQARVISLPSQTCVYKVKVTETSCVAKAEIILFKDSVCLTCYVANGHIVVFSLPTLKPLLDVDYIGAPNIRL